MGKICTFMTGLLMSLYLYGYSIIPVYRIQTSISAESPTERHTILKVIVYRNHFDESLIREIENFFINLNGYPTKLEMRLHFDGNNRPYKTIHFDYE